MGKKRPLGFKTPSTRIQEEYQETLEHLMKRKANWVKILTDRISAYKFISEGADDIIKSTESKERSHEELMELEHRILLVGHCITHVMVARIGQAQFISA